MSGPGRPRATCDHDPEPCRIVTYRSGGRWYSACRTRMTQYERKRRGRHDGPRRGSILHNIEVGLGIRSDSEIGRELHFDHTTVRYHRLRYCRCDLPDIVGVL